MAQTRNDGHCHDATTGVLPGAAPSAPAIRVEFGARTHVGHVRPNNEDQYLIVRLRKSVDVLATTLPPEEVSQFLQREGFVLLVADGMGGAAAGERASALVVREAIRHLLETAKWFFRLDDPDEEVRMRLLRETLERVDRQLIREAEEDPTLAGMGTTLTALSVIGADAFIVHIGDSRAYLFRDGRLEQLTRDHTVVQELVDKGVLRPEEARTHRMRHIITNAIGGRPGVEGEIVKLRLLDGDRFLLCTDGLHGSVRDDEIAAVLVRHPGPEDACVALVEAALSRGGRDNVTAVVAACSLQGTAPK